MSISSLPRYRRFFRPRLPAARLYANTVGRACAEFATALTWHPFIANTIEVLAAHPSGVQNTAVLWRTGANAVGKLQKPAWNGCTTATRVRARASDIRTVASDTHIEAPITAGQRDTACR